MSGSRLLNSHPYVSRQVNNDHPASSVVTSSAWQFSNYLWLHLWEVLLQIDNYPNSWWCLVNTGCLICTTLQVQNISYNKQLQQPYELTISYLNIWWHIEMESSQWMQRWLPIAWFQCSLVQRLHDDTQSLLFTSKNTVFR